MATITRTDQSSRAGVDSTRWLDEGAIREEQDIPLSAIQVDGCISQDPRGYSLRTDFLCPPLHCHREYRSVVQKFNQESDAVFVAAMKRIKKEETSIKKTYQYSYSIKMIRAIEDLYEEVFSEMRASQEELFLEMQSKYDQLDQLGPLNSDTAYLTQCRDVILSAAFRKTRFTLGIYSTAFKKNTFPGLYNTLLYRATCGDASPDYLSKFCCAIGSPDFTRLSPEEREALSLFQLRMIVRECFELRRMTEDIIKLVTDYLPNLKPLNHIPLEHIPGELRTQCDPNAFFNSYLLPLEARSVFKEDLSPFFSTVEKVSDLIIKYIPLKNEFLFQDESEEWPKCLNVTVPKVQISTEVMRYCLSDDPLEKGKRIGETHYVIAVPSKLFDNKGQPRAISIETLDHVMNDKKNRIAMHVHIVATKTTQTNPPVEIPFDELRRITLKGPCVIVARKELLFKNYSKKLQQQKITKMNEKYGTQYEMPSVIDVTMVSVSHYVQTIKYPLQYDYSRCAEDDLVVGHTPAHLSVTTEKKAKNNIGVMVMSKFPATEK